MSYKISVIIPVYNAEKHLDNTINSIIKQSIGFENIELILVDDASTDNSKKIIESYSEKYANIIPYYSEKNHGYPGFGRNIGLNTATSDYIMFMDNDDEYDVNMCETLYETIINENADIVVCGRMMVNQSNNIEEKIHHVYGTEENDKIILKNEELLYFNSHIILNKIFKKEIITSNNLKFNEHSRLDDDMFTWDYYLNSEKMVYLNKYYGYRWNVRTNSLSHTNGEEYIPEIMECILYEFYQLKKFNKEEHIQFRAKNAIQWLIYETSFISSRKKLKDILKKIHNFENEIQFNGKLDAKWAKSINNLILKEHYGYASLLIKSLNISRKVYQKIKFKKI